jgi:tetratricopeptide (TPR) repeat protein
MAEAERAIVASDWTRAAGLLDLYLWHRPRDSEAIRSRVEIARHLGDGEAALAWLGRVPADAPEAASAQLSRGLLLKELFRAREAEAAYREAIRLAPNTPEPWRELVALLGLQRRGEEQEQALWGFHRAGAAVEALRLLGQSAVVIPPGTIAKTTDEGAILRRCLEADPDASQVRSALARVHRLRGETSQALALLDPWLDLHPDDPSNRVEWLACRLDEGDVEGTAAWFEPLSTRLRDLADYRRLRGDWLGLQGRHAEALADDRAAVARAPRDPEARYRLARRLRDAGRPEEAEEALAHHRAVQNLAARAAAVNPEAPDPAAVADAWEACRALGATRLREADAWAAIARRLPRPASTPTRKGSS